MPSPFPGMDPYVEHPDVFPCMHNNLIFVLQESLQPRLPEPYYAATGERVRLERESPEIVPDAQVRRRRTRRTGQLKQQVATATTLRAKPVVIRVPETEIREPYLNIYVQDENRDRVVTTIEVLSPTNKTASSSGRSDYCKKQQNTLKVKVHLVELDLLRAGIHTTAVPVEALRRRLEPFDYHVCIHCYNRCDEFQVYPIRLQEALPELAIPLLPKDGSVTVDLKAVFDRAYDAGPFSKQIRYHKLSSLVPPLPPDQQEWVRRLLRQQGIRTSR